MCIRDSYVGNDNPALETFQKIAPEVKRRLNFWKPLRLRIISKSDRNLPGFKTVVRYLILFNTSWNRKRPKESFFGLSFFSKEEKWNIYNGNAKITENGGIKLISIKRKAEVPKIHWLIWMVIDDTLRLHKEVASTLVGTQRSGLSLLDIIFSDIYLIMRKRLVFRHVTGRKKLNSFKKLHYFLLAASYNGGRAKSLS